MNHILIQAKAQTPVYKFAKRMFDLVVAILMPVCVAPLLIVITILIKLTSPGPVLFRQSRVGLRGKAFTMLKFRTMYQSDRELKDFLGTIIADAGESSDLDGRVFKIQSDPRMTVIGRFLRRSSLDELPALFNVVSGDLSLVGPRPALPFEVHYYNERESIRFAVKPGITGPWILSRGPVSWEKSKEMDVDYVSNANLFTDFVILAQTLVRGFSSKGAY